MTKIELLACRDGFGTGGGGVFQFRRVGIALSGDNAAEAAEAQRTERNDKGLDYCFSSQDMALTGSPKTLAVTPSLAYFSDRRCIAT